MRGVLVDTCQLVYFFRGESVAILSFFDLGRCLLLPVVCDDFSRCVLVPLSRVRAPSLSETRLRIVFPLRVWSLHHVRRLIFIVLHLKFS